MSHDAKKNLAHYERDERPWGYFERFTANESCTVKIIFVKPGEEFSLQTHGHRGEFWKIIEGSGTITVGTSVQEGSGGDSFFIPKATEHRAKAGEKGLQILEIAFGPFDENDIVRLEDDYGRV